MDLKKLVSSDTAECVINDPHTGRPTDLSIKVYGIDSARFREVTKGASKAHAQAISKGDEPPEGPAVDAERLAMLTAGWSGLTDGGKEVKFTLSKAQEIYQDSPEIRRQIDRFIFQVANFLPKA